MLDKTDLRPMTDHMDMIQYVYREWNQEADRLTQVAREKGVTWNSYTIGRRERVEAVRGFFDGGKAPIKIQVGSAFLSFKWRTDLRKTCIR